MLIWECVSFRNAYLRITDFSNGCLGIKHALENKKHNEIDKKFCCKHVPRLMLMIQTVF